MTNYTVDIQGFIPEFDQIILTADDREQAEYFALEQIRENYPDWVDGEIVRLVEAD